MEIIKKPKKIDHSIFNKNNKNLEARYGLPKNIIYCDKCVQSNQMPRSTTEFENTIENYKKTLNFNKNNICDACLFAEKKKKIDWNEREQELIQLCDKYRKDDGSYDCVAQDQEEKIVYMQHTYLNINIK